MEKELKAIEEGVQSFHAKADALTTEVKAATDGVKEIKSEIVVIKDEADKNQKAIDSLLTQFKENMTNTAKSNKSFTEVFSDQVTEEFGEITKAVSKGGRYKMELKTVGNMTIANNILSGNSVVNYGTNAILPAQWTNFRDYIRTSNSSTLVQAYYRESAGEGSISKQTEGSAKTQIDFDLTEVKTVTKYVAGFARFSKQLAKSLPFFTQTLPTMLLREFYAAENAAFYATVNGAATGSTTTAETDDVKQIIDYIANQRVAKFDASVAFVNHAQMARLNKLTYGTGYYSGSGGVVTAPNGAMTISGVQIIPVHWVDDDKFLLIDQNFLERVEAEPLAIEFFPEDSDNVQKNLITARIECLEEVNLMFPASAIFADLGNVA